VDPIAGSVDLPVGSQARYSYHFDHNALTDGVLAGRSLLAITDSGNLLEFNAGSLVLSGQAIVPGRASSIAKESVDSALTLKATSRGQLLLQVCPLLVSEKNTGE
jgi:hypothetical protein